jgi:hypothetical protein
MNKKRDSRQRHTGMTMNFSTMRLSKCHSSLTGYLMNVMLSFAKEYTRRPGRKKRIGLP